MPIIPIVCPVCLSTVVPDDKLSNPGCGHVFHSGCIEEWFRVQSNRKCPHCRVSSRASQSQPIYLQFDENALNETRDIQIPQDDDVQEVKPSKGNSELENEIVNLKRNIYKLNSEYSSYQNKVKSEKTQQDQTLSFLSNQLSNAESNLAEKSAQFTTLTKRYSKIKGSLEQSQNDLTRKDYKIQDLERQLKASQQKIEAEIDRPCQVRDLLKSKSSEIREKVEQYKHMGEHGIQILAELTIALDGEKRQMKSEMQSLKVDVEILKQQKDNALLKALESNYEASKEKQLQKSSSKSVLKRQESSCNSNMLDDTLEYSFEQSSIMNKRLSGQSNYELFSSPENKENISTVSVSQPAEVLKSESISPISSAISVKANSQMCSSSSLRSDKLSSNSSRSEQISTPGSSGQLKRKAFVPLRDGDDDILMEQTVIIESPEFKNPFSKVKGSLLSRTNNQSRGSNFKRTKTSETVARISSNSRQYNGLGFSSAPLFKKSTSCPKPN